MTRTFENAGRCMRIISKEENVMEKKKHSIKDDFSMLALMIMPVGVAVNFVGGQLAGLLKLPVYMDTIGTIFTGMLCGPWVGAVTGCLTNIVIGIADPTGFPFIPVSVVLGLVSGFLSRKNMFGNWWKCVISAFILGISSTIVSAPIVVLVYGGVTGAGTSLLTATALAAGANIWEAVIGTAGIFTVIDRIIALVISILVIRVIPARTLVKFGCGSNYIKENK